MTHFADILQLYPKHTSIQLEKKQPRRTFDTLIIQPGKSKVSSTPKKKQKTVPNKTLQTQSVGNFSHQILDSCYLSGKAKEWILKTYYRIIENTCQVKLIYFYLFRIYYSVLSSVVSEQPESKLHSLGDSPSQNIASVDKVSQILSKLGFYTQETSERMTLSNILTSVMASNQDLYLSYTRCFNVPPNAEMGIPTPISTSGFWGCHRQFSSPHQQYERSIVDSSHLRYRNNIPIQALDFDYHQSICQPLDIVGSDEKPYPEFEKNQSMTGDKAPTNIVCLDGMSHSPHLYHHYKNKSSLKKTEYIEDLYEPHLSSQNVISYVSPLKKRILGTNESLQQRFQKCIVEKTDYSIQSSPPKKLEVQIKQLEKLIKTLDQATHQLCLNITSLQNDQKPEIRVRVQGKIETTYPLIKNLSIFQTPETHSKTKMYQYYWIRNTIYAC